VFCFIKVSPPALWECGNLCAGINRQGAGDAKALRERSSDPLGPEFCAGHREVLGEA
jgi:hypothetical protein